MRAYAFTGRNRKTLVGLSLAYIGLIAVNLWTFTVARNLPSESFYQMIGPTGCYPAYSGVIIYFLGVSHIDLLARSQSLIISLSVSWYEIVHRYIMLLIFMSSSS